MADSGLKNRVVIVTGANNPEGIGAATARAFAAEAARVVLHSYQPEGTSPAGGAPLPPPGGERYARLQRVSAERVAEEIRARGGEVAVFEGGLADPATPARLFAFAEQALGPVEILVNNAAHWEADTFIPSEHDVETWHRDVFGEGPQRVSPHTHDRLSAVNTRAVSLLMAEFARRHVARQSNWGRIINVSTDGAFCFPNEASYGASKYALESYSRTAAHELGRYGITVNSVSLGPVQTGWITPELEAQLLLSIPLRRIGRPPDVADVIVFLASHQARWITGQVIYVGGGHRMG